MKESWEINWKDYYQILQVHPSAEPEVIEAAYDKLARKYHPDVNHTPAASQRMKDINEAYEILSHSEKRRHYDAAYGRQTSQKTLSQPTEPQKPNPQIRPDIIRFENLKLGEIQKGTFIVENTGGPFTKMSISKPLSWLKITGQRPQSETDPLPLIVEIEARGEDWDEKQVGNIVVKLDEVEAHMRVELTTQLAPKNVRQKRELENRNWEQYPDFREWLMEGNHRILMINPLMAYILYLMEKRNSE